MENNYELCHWGIKGMKWGIRRFQKKDGSLTPAGKKRYKDDVHEDYAKAHSKKSVKSMSNQELRDRNNRLQAERQYRDLTRRENKGKKYVDMFVASATTIAAVAGAVATYKKHVGPIMSKVGDQVLKKGINVGTIA